MTTSSPRMQAMASSPKNTRATNSPKIQAMDSRSKLEALDNSAEASSGSESEFLETESDDEVDSDSQVDSNGQVDSYIASLHLERNNTRVGHRHLIQRRKTLMKQARNPQADQEALEQEIRQVERLASLLGRRQTRFNRKRGAPKVNHDLDATLTGFFDVEDNDHVGEVLLSAGHRHDEADDVDDAVIDNPQLTAKNIHAAPAALLAQEQQSGDYQHSDDLFDKIEEMNMAESPSGSAEYLPLDTYKSEEITVAAASSNSLQGSLVGSNSAEARVSSGKLAADVADADDEDDDNMLLGVIRSATWKRHSSALIKEREQHGPAMPAIIDEEDEEEVEDCAVTEPKYISEVAAAETTAAPTSTATAENKVLMAQKNAALTRKLSLMRARVMANAQDSLAQAGSRSGLRTEDAGPEPEQAVEFGVPSVLSPLSPPGASIVDDYMDILDFMDSAQPTDVSDRDDGHISSDLLGNSYSSSTSSSIDLSAADSSDSADSDSHYLAQLIQPRRLSVVNVVNEPRVLPAVEPPATTPPVAEPSVDTVDTVDTQTPALSYQKPALEAASVATAGMLNNRSTLRRNRRIMSRGRGLRGGHTSMLGPRSATEPSAESSARSSDVDSGERSRTIDSHAASEHLASTLRASLSLGSPEKVVEDIRPRTVGLAQLARDAISMNEQHTNTRMRHIQPLLSSAMSQKPLPPIPDRLLRTLEVADTKAAAQLTPEAADAKSVLQRMCPPLPTKERPRLPRILAEDGLATRPELAAARARPSSMRLFGCRRDADALDPPLGSPRALQRPATAQSLSPTVPSTVQSLTPTEPVTDDTPLGLREWLQRTDMLLPSNNRVSKPLPYPPSSSGKSPSFVSYHYQPASPSSNANPSRTASGRVLKKVMLLPPAQPQRPSSASSSNISSAPLNPNSPRISCVSATSSPATSNRNSIAAAALPHPEPCSRPATDTAPCSPSSSSNPSVADPNTALFTPATEHSGALTSALSQPPKVLSKTLTDGSYSPVSAMAGPTVFSAPPGAEPDYDPHAAGMVEPSAPMLMEPTAPEFPTDWAVPGAQDYAFPTPTHYQPSAPEPSALEPSSPHNVMGFALPPPVLRKQYLPSVAQQQYVPPVYQKPSVYQQPPMYQQPQKRPPALPEKPRPYQPDVLGLAGHSNALVPAEAVLSPSAEYIMVEGTEEDEEKEDAEQEKARLNAIADEYQNNNSSGVPSRDGSGLPSRTSSLSAKPADVSLELSVVTQIKKLSSDESASYTDVKDPPLPQYSRNDSDIKKIDPVDEVLEKERQREGKRKAALFELVDTERTYTDDLRMVVELFLLPIQLLGNRKIVDVVFGDMVKITEMNGKMYFDMITRLGPLACLVDPKRAGRNRRKKKNALKAAASPHIGHSRSVLQGSSIRSPATPAIVSASASNTMSRRISNPGDPPHSSPRASVYSYDIAHDSASLNRTGSRQEDRLTGDDMSVHTSNSGGLNVDTIGLRGLFSATTERQNSVRSHASVPEEEEFDEDNASKWTENQVLDYFKNVCIGDVMASYLKDFSEHYALYSANHDKAIEYLKLVRESSSRLNLRNDATRDAHQKLLLTLEQAEKDPRVRRLRLESFLLAPVQRVMRYPLLLEALLKYTPEDHPDHDDVALALSISGSVATEVDRKSEELMNRQRLAELQSTFDWAHLLGGVQLKLDTFTKLVGQRKFVRKGPLRKASSGKHLYAILFNDFMMITVSDRRGGVWCYEPYRLPIQTYDMLARDPVKDQFELVNLKNGEVLQLRADTAAEASDWVKDIMKTANYCYEVMCEALRSGIQVSKVKSVISPEARNKILQGSKPTSIGKRH